MPVTLWDQRIKAVLCVIIYWFGTCACILKERKRNFESTRNTWRETGKETCQKGETPSSHNCISLKATWERGIEHTPSPDAIWLCFHVEEMIYNYIYFDYYFIPTGSKREKEKERNGMGWRISGKRITCCCYLSGHLAVFFPLNPLTPVSDQEIISPYNINIISTR